MTELMVDVRNFTCNNWADTRADVIQYLVQCRSGTPQMWWNYGHLRTICTDAGVRVDAVS